MGNVFIMPWVGMMYRVAQFEEYVKSARVIDIQDQDGEGVDLIEKLPQKGKIILILRRVLLMPDGIRIARQIEKWLVGFEGGVVFMHEMAPSELALHRGWPSWVMANHMNYRLLEQGAVGNYLINVSKEMGVSFNTAEINRITTSYGGWLWLVKDVVRTKGEHTGWDIVQLLDHERIQQKMSLLWESWPKEYQEVILGMKEDEIVEREMKDIGIVSDRGEIIGLELAKFVEKQKIDELVVTNDKLTYRGKDLSEKFVPGERRVLARLWANQEMVGREEISKLFWEGEGVYEATDWAIDQKMRRLRQKLLKLMIPIVIVTKKGEGYGISND